MKIRRNVAFTNWAGTFTSTADLFFTVENENELFAIVEKAVRKEIVRIRLVGSGHSPSDIAMAGARAQTEKKETPRIEYWLIDIGHLDSVYEINLAKSTITVGAGMTLSALNRELEKHDLALSNLGSISDQTIAGSLSTGTHGTGHEHGILASMIQEMTILLPPSLNGSPARFSPARLERCSLNCNAKLFSAALCSLGCLGVIIKVTFRCEPAFRLHSVQTVEPVEAVMSSWGEIFKSAEHVRVWYFPYVEKCVVWRADRTHKKSTTLTPAPSTLASRFYELGLLCSNVSPSLISYVTRKYFYASFNDQEERVDTSYKQFNFDCLFKQWVSEWAVDWNGSLAVFKNLVSLVGQLQKGGFPVHSPIELRISAKDNIFLSPCYGRDTLYIGIIHYRPFGFDVALESRVAYWNKFEDLMRHSGGRPHWAKTHSVTPTEFKGMYPKFDEFLELRSKIDPNSIFVNDYIERHLTGTSFSLANQRVKILGEQNRSSEVDGRRIGLTTATDSIETGISKVVSKL